MINILVVEDDKGLNETVRKVEKNMPILFMTARDDFAAKSKGYELGIDDYMVKPIHFEELLLRIKALLRRANIASSKRIEIGNLIADENEVSVYVDGKNVDITLKEFLLYLVKTRRVRQRRW